MIGDISSSRICMLDPRDKMKSMLILFREIPHLLIFMTDNINRDQCKDESMKHMFDDINVEEEAEMALEDLSPETLILMTKLYNIRWIRLMVWNGRIVFSPPTYTAPETKALLLVIKILIL